MQAGSRLPERPFLDHELGPDQAQLVVKGIDGCDDLIHSRPGCPDIPGEVRAVGCGRVDLLGEGIDLMPHVVKLVFQIICGGGGHHACDDNEGG